MEEKSEFKSIYEYSIRLLSQRDYSVHKMKQKLLTRTKDNDVIELVLAKLKELNYLREEEYKRSRIKQLLVKGYANHYICKRLELEFLSTTEDEIDHIRKDQNLESHDQIKYLIEKKLRGKTIPTDFENKMKLQNKITRFLISKGYSFQDVQDHLNL